MFPVVRNPQMASSTPEMSVMCEQVFSRKSLGYIWSKRNEIDPGQMAIIGALYNNRKKGSIKGSVRVEYKLARSIVGKLGYGRLYGTRGSLETLEREIRGTLCEEFYHDIDVKNAHPVILHQYAKTKYSREMPAVKQYCDNRDACLNAISPNRDEAKTAFLKVMYGGKCEYPFLANYEKEVSSFARMLGAQEEYAELVRHLRKQDKNVYASLLALILQTEERHIMLAMKSSLEKQGWSVDVLAYDGVMVRKNPEIKLTDEMLREVEKDILIATGYVVELVDKAFEKYEVPADAGEIVPKVSMEKYRETKQRFEENHFYYSENNTIAEVAKNGTLKFMSLEHAATKLNGFDFIHSTTNLTDRTPFLSLWLKDSTRRSHSIIDQKPNDEDPEVYSPPIKFRWEEFKKCSNCKNDPINNDAEIIQCFNDLVLLAAGKNEEIKTFIVCWLAHIVQQPFKNPLSAVILTGKEGCGKDTLGDFMCEWIVGDSFAFNYESNDQFWDKHDCTRMGKFFVKIEEANGFLNRQNAGRMKSIITSRTLTVNPKGVAGITTANYNRFMMTTNDGTPVKCEEGSRRFMISACSSEKIGDVAHWKKVRKTLFNPEGADTIGNYLSELDLSDFEPTVFPKNEYMDQLKENEKSAEQRFIKAWDGAELRVTELFEKYCEFCAANKLNGVPTISGFGHKLLPFVRDREIFKTTKDNLAYYAKP